MLIFHWIRDFYYIYSYSLELFINSCSDPQLISPLALSLNMFIIGYEKLEHCVRSSFRQFWMIFSIGILRALKNFYFIYILEVDILKNKAYYNCSIIITSYLPIIILFYKNTIWIINSYISFLYHLYAILTFHFFIL
jgi:hypothetical protein